MKKKDFVEHSEQYNFHILVKITNANTLLTVKFQNGMSFDNDMILLFLTAQMHKFYFIFKDQRLFS